MSDIEDSNPVGPPSLGSPGPDTRGMKASLEAKLFDSSAEPLRFGRYHVLDRLGRGGMGTVFRAIDPDLDRQVAVKALRRRATTKAARAKMVREARTMARLSHPNVVAVLEVGLEGDEVFVAMEYVDGGTLRDWCHENPVDAPGRFERALDLAVQALHGLAAAHAAGLVHRDLKPSNMLIGRDGRLRIADFGLARSVSSDESASDTIATSGSSGTRLGELDPLHWTAADAVVGTPLYMAPEQFEGRSTAGSDQFSWCVTFHEVFFGARPFAADTASGLQEQIAARHFIEPPGRVRVPGWIRPILLRGLEPDPTRRWPNITAVLEAIERRRRPRRWPWALAAGGSLALAGILTRSPSSDEPAVVACSDERERLDAVWGAEARAAIETNLVSAAAENGAATWARVVKRMDAMTVAWTRGRLEACRQQRDRDPEIAAVGERRAACLDRALGSFAFVADALAGSEGRVVDHAIPVLLALGDKVACDTDDVHETADEAIDDEALAQLDRAFLLDAARRGPEAIEILTQLAARLPTPSRLRARALVALAETHANLGSPGRDAAIEVARDALAEAETADDSALLVSAWRVLARAETIYGDRERARFAIERARNIATRPEIDDLERARTEFADATLLEHSGELVEAAAHYREAIVRARELRADSVELAFMLMDAAGPLLLAGSPEEATSAIAESVALCDEVLGPKHPETALALIRSAQIGVQVGRDGVLPELTRAEAILIANPHFHPEALVDVRMTRADLLLRARQLPEALVAIDGAIESLETSLGKDDPYRIALANFRAKILLGLERPHDARAEAHDVLTRFVGVQGRMARAHAELRMDLARAEAALGHPDAARQELGNARAILDPLYDPATVPGHNYRVRVAEILAAVGDFRDAIALLEDLAAHTAPELPPIDHAQMWLSLASSRHAAHDRAGAQAALARALPFIDPEDPELAADLAEVESRLAKP